MLGCDIKGVLFLFICILGNVSSDDDEYRLINDLLRDYDHRIRPSLNSSLPLNVTFGLALSQVIDVDEKNQILTTNCWLNQVWTDYKLTWDPRLYGGIKVMRLPFDAIWKPDILLCNNADVSSYKSSISTNVIVTSDGNVTWLSMVIFKSSCAVDVRYFPFDEQNCSLVFASWTYDGFQLNLVLVGTEGDTSNYINNTEWALVGVHARRNVVYYSCCAEPFPDITYTIQIRRKPLFYVFNMILPCFLITLVALLGFYIPSDCGEKVSMGITTLLSMTVFLMLVTESMPPTSDVLPLVGLYYGITIGIVSLATAMTVLTLNIHHKGQDGRPVPRILRILCFRYLAKFLFLRLTPTPLISGEKQRFPASRKFAVASTKFAENPVSRQCNHTQLDVALDSAEELELSNKTTLPLKRSSQTFKNRTTIATTREFSKLNDICTSDCALISTTYVAAIHPKNDIRPSHGQLLQPQRTASSCERNTSQKHHKQAQNNKIFSPNDCISQRKSRDYEISRDNRPCNDMAMRSGNCYSSRSNQTNPGINSGAYRDTTYYFHNADTHQYIAVDPVLDFPGIEHCGTGDVDEKQAFIFRGKLNNTAPKKDGYFSRWCASSCDGQRKNLPFDTGADGAAQKSDRETKEDWEDEDSDAGSSVEASEAGLLGRPGEGTISGAGLVGADHGVGLHGVVCGTGRGLGFSSSTLSSVWAALSSVNQAIDRYEDRLGDREKREIANIEWQQVSVVVDRLLLVAFTVATVAITLGILLHAPLSLDFIVSLWQRGKQLNVDDVIESSSGVEVDKVELTTSTASGL